MCSESSSAARDGAFLHASLPENGQIGAEVTRILVDDADAGVNAAFDVRILTVWAAPTLQGEHLVRTLEDVECTCRKIIYEV